MGYFYFLGFGIFVICIYFINDHLKIIKKGESKYLGSLLAVLAISFTALVIFWFFQNLPKPFDFSDLGQDETKRSALGALGDYFGGLLNPLFAFLSFMGVLWTLKMSREELSETRAVMNEQLKTQSLQQFDSLYFSMLSQLTSKIETLNASNVIDDLHQDIYKSTFNTEIWKKKEYIGLLELIYCVIENIESNFNENKQLDEIDRKKYKDKYMGILRSILPEKVIHFIIHDCERLIGNPMLKERKSIIEKYAFFQNLTYEGLDYRTKYWLLINLMKFDPRIFGQNASYKKLNGNVISNFLSDAHPQSIEWNLWKFFKNDEKTIDVEGAVLAFLVAENVILKLICGDDLNIKLVYGSCVLKDFYIQDNSLIFVLNHNEIERIGYKFIFDLQFIDKKIVIEKIIMQALNR